MSAHFVSRLRADEDRRDPEEKMSNKKAVPFVVGSLLKSSGPKKPARPKNRSTRPRFSLEEALSDLCLAASPDDDPLNANLELERGLRSVAFLLHSLSNGGNLLVPGYAALGLAHILDRYAGEIGWRAGRNLDPARRLGSRQS